MQTIIAIVGESGTGKTTLCQYLKNIIPTVVSFTNRPMRFGETDGKEHWFVHKGYPVPAEDERLAYTKFGDSEYWVELNQVKSLGHLFTYIIDEDGLVNMVNKFGDEFNIIKVRITRSNKDEDVDTNRQARDHGRFELPYSYYDIVLPNDTTIADLAMKLLNCLLVRKDIS